MVTAALFTFTQQSNQLSLLDARLSCEGLTAIRRSSGQSINSDVQPRSRQHLRWFAKHCRACVQCVQAASAGDAPGATPPRRAATITKVREHVLYVHNMSEGLTISRYNFSSIWVDHVCRVKRYFVEELSVLLLHWPHKDNQTATA